MTVEIVERLAAVLAAAGPAHHAAYIETDGDDPEWPIWYANHVADDVRRILERPDLTVSRLVWAFVDTDQGEQSSQHPREDEIAGALQVRGQESAGGEDPRADHAGHDQAHRREAPDVAWPTFYAERFTAEL